MKRLRATVTRIVELLDRLADWYWGDPVRWRRRIVEEDARRLGGQVTWRD